MGILAGLRVVEVSAFVAAPSAGACGARPTACSALGSTSTSRRASRAAPRPPPPPPAPPPSGPRDARRAPLLALRQLSRRRRLRSSTARCAPISRCAAPPAKRACAVARVLWHAHTTRVSRRHAARRRGWRARQGPDHDGRSALRRDRDAGRDRVHAQRRRRHAVAALFHQPRVRRHLPEGYGHAVLLESSSCECAGHDVDP